MNKFATAVGKTPFVVAVTDDAVTVHRADNSGHTMKFDKDLKPVSLDRGPANSELYFSVDSASAPSNGLAAISAIDAHGISLPRPVNGVGAIPEALEVISKVSSTPGFPQDIAEKIPAAYKKLGLPEPQRQR